MKKVIVYIPLSIYALISVLNTLLHFFRATYMSKTTNRQVNPYLQSHLSLWYLLKLSF